jgi:hypothetical protein
MAGDDLGPNQLTVPSDDPNGFCHTYRDVGFCLRTAMGRMEYNRRVGLLDVRCGSGSFCYPVAVLYSVCICLEI